MFVALRNIAPVTVLKFDLDQGFVYLRMVKIATTLDLLNVVATDQYLEFCREMLNEEDAT